jgi:hypothetical protein
VKEGRVRDKDTPEQPEKKQDAGGSDTGSDTGSGTGPDRAQPELTEQNLLNEQRDEADDPARKKALEGELEEMTDDIKDANDK